MKGRRRWERIEEYGGEELEEVGEESEGNAKGLGAGRNAGAARRRE